jgi:hypothetical protein
MKKIVRHRKIPFPYKCNCHEKERDQEAPMPLIRFLLSIVQREAWCHQPLDFLAFRRTAHVQCHRRRRRTKYKPYGTSQSSHADRCNPLVPWACGKRQHRHDFVVTCEVFRLCRVSHDYLFIYSYSPAHCMVLRKVSPLYSYNCGIASHMLHSFSCKDVFLRIETRNLHLYIFLTIYVTTYLLLRAISVDSFTALFLRL